MIKCDHAKLMGKAVQEIADCAFAARCDGHSYDRLIRIERRHDRHVVIRFKNEFDEADLTPVHPIGLNGRFHATYHLIVDVDKAESEVSCLFLTTI